MTLNDDPWPPAGSAVAHMAYFGTGIAQVRVAQVELG